MMRKWTPSSGGAVEVEGVREVGVGRGVDEFARPVEAGGDLRLVVGVVAPVGHAGPAVVAEVLEGEAGHRRDGVVLPADGLDGVRATLQELEHVDAIAVAGGTEAHAHRGRGLPLAVAPPHLYEAEVVGRGGFDGGRFGADAAARGVRPNRVGGGLVVCLGGSVGFVGHRSEFEVGVAVGSARTESVRSAPRWSVVGRCLSRLGI